MNIKPWAALTVLAIALCQTGCGSDETQARKLGGPVAIAKTAQTAGKDTSKPGNAGISFVYNSGCNCGKKAPEWEQAFAAAEVVTFDRLSAGGEHLWWLWFDAPDRLKEIR